MNIGVWSWNLQTDEIELDEKIMELYNLDETFENNSNQIFQHVLQEDLPNVLSSADKCIRGEAPYDPEFGIRRKDGSIRWEQEEKVSYH